MYTEEQLFEECFEQAKLALVEKEVAIGCLFYHKDWDRVLAKGRNSVNITKNATRHAEMNCIDDLISYCRDKNLSTELVWPSIIVYVTCEPCIMCTRILRHLKVDKVKYGCSNERFGGCGSVINVARSCEFGMKTLDYSSGHREELAIDLLRTFYSGENTNAPEEIRKVKRFKKP